MISLSSSANAQFIGINVDYGIDYSAAPGKVNGYSVGISHPAPFIPNFGYSSISFKDIESIRGKATSTDSDGDYKLSLETETTITTINLFYNVPFPVVTITVGFGGGSKNLNTGVEAKRTIDETYKDGTSNKLTLDDLEDTVIEAFFHIGLPFWNTVEFHLGYHLMSFSSIDIAKGVSLDGDYTIDKKSYSGGMTTIGVQVAF
jgi:hypothetical protein